MRENVTLSKEQGEISLSPLLLSLEFGLSITASVLLIFTSLVGIAANMFVAWAVRNQKALQTSNNALLVNLAIIDFLRCVVDCPLIAIIFINTSNSSDLGFSLCAAQVGSFSLTSCVQLLTLVSISAERYQAVVHPFQTSERRRRVMIWISMTWTVAISISSVCVTFVRDSPVYMRCRGSNITWIMKYDSFGLFVLTPMWFISLVVITGFYTRIFMIVKAHSRKIFDKGSFLAPGKKKKEKMAEASKAHQDDNLPQEAVVKIEVSNSAVVQVAGDEPSVLANQEVPRYELQHITSENPQSDTTQDQFEEPLPELMQVEELPENHQESDSSVTNVSTLPTEESQISDSLSGGQSSEVLPQTTAPLDTVLSGLPEDHSAVPPQNIENVTVGPPLPVLETQALDIPPAGGEQKEEMFGAVCMMPSLVNRDRARKNKEGKLAKRSGYIILTFLLFWTPFIVTVLGSFFTCRNNNLAVTNILDLEILTVSLVCMTSAANPIVYAVVNPQFRNEFYHLKAKCKVMWEKS
ncbi:parietopsin [Denticeps clupeoides]|uniref:parietopsin n=1 Tax=Denticeps clupeoides TaxID=299321 RepID=UPI0010A49A1C|nr:uncharacterized protein LOC114767229 [Denticeps clupeoides]